MALTSNFLLDLLSSRQKGWHTRMNANLTKLGKLFCVDNAGDFWIVQNAIYDPDTDTWSQTDTGKASTAVRMNDGGETITYLCESGNPVITWVFYAHHVVGEIIMFSGLAGDVPIGWHICDGTNGTPDLRDQFVVGAGDVYDVGDTGGEESHTLTIGEMPAHSHNVAKYSMLGGETNLISGNGYTTLSYQATTEVGGGGAHENRPPYYALYYIMFVGLLA